jgi:transcriptional regulator with XRE-family HTH domain
MPTYLRNDKFIKQFGRRLRRLRRSKDLTIYQVSDASGITANHIALTERGEINTSISHAYLLSKALKVKPHELFLFNEDEFK